MVSGKKNILGWGILFIGILLFVWLIRYFLVGSYHISTHSMEEALHKGDYILVRKLAAKNRLKRNEIILFTSPLQKDREHPPLILSRCIALPGDTIQVGHNGYKVNGKLYPRSPYSLVTYTVNKAIKETFLGILKKRDIPLRSPVEAQINFTLRLTPFEEYQIREELNERMNKYFITDASESYSLVVPQKGKSYRVTESFLTASREVILAEATGQVTFRDRKLQIDGKEVKTYRFNRDCYWLLSDNVNEAIDSRHLGFIPSDHVIGKAWFCWYSKDKHRRLKKIK